MKRRHLLIVLALLLAAFILSGCASAEQKEIATAIETALQTQMDNDTSFGIFKYKDILKQVQAEDKAKKEAEEEPAEQMATEATETQYHIIVQIPDLKEYDASALEVEEPPHDPKTTHSVDYEDDYEVNFAKALKPALAEETELTATDIELIVDVSKLPDEGWVAHIQSNSYDDMVADIRSDLMPSIIQKMVTLDGYKLLKAHSAFISYFMANLEDPLLVDSIEVDTIAKDSDGTYTVSASYIDPEKLYAEAETRAYDEYKEDGKGFYDYYEEDTDSSFDTHEEMLISEVTERVSLEVKDVTTNLDNHEELSTLVQTVNTARNAHQNSLFKRVNEDFVYHVIDKPGTGVLSGANSGVSIAIRTEAALGDIYVTFYTLSGSDIYEDDPPLALSAFLRAGDSLTVYLPVGNYKMIQGTGDEWYGEPPAFGPYGDYQESDAILTVEGGYTYTLTLYTIEDGNLPSSSIPFPY